MSEEQDAKDLRIIAGHLRNNRGIAVMPTFAMTLESVADSIDSLRSRLADAERERDGLRKTLLSLYAAASRRMVVMHIKHASDCDDAIAQAGMMLKMTAPIIITRISHPESNARPADAGADIGRMIEEGGYGPEWEGKNA